MDVTQYLPPAWLVWTVVGACTLAATVMTTRAAMRSLRNSWATRRARIKADQAGGKGQADLLEDWLTRAVAAIATGVSAQGMWRFTGDVLALDGFLRVALFAFIELAMVTSAVRARRSMREKYSAGLDGIAVWALAVLTAVLSSLDAHSAAEAIFRLAAPLVAAWMWERGMRLERHRMRGTSGINWRLTPERLLVWMGLAEAKERTASEVDAHRRITRVALAAKKVHQLRTAGAKGRKLRRAVAARDRMLDRAVQHTGLSGDTRMQWALLDQVTTLGGADSLSDLLDTATGPWTLLDHPAVTGAAKHHEAVQLASAMREWTDALNAQRDPEVSSAVTSMAAYIARLEGRPMPAFETGRETKISVDVEVSQQEIDDLIDRIREEPRPAPDETGDETADETRATEAMWAHWQKIVQAERRIPTGTELATVGKCTPQYGARKAREWEAAMDGRTRHALKPRKKV